MHKHNVLLLSVVMQLLLAAAAAEVWAQKELLLPLRHRCELPANVQGWSRSQNANEELYHVHMPASDIRCSSANPYAHPARQTGRLKPGPQLLALVGDVTFDLKQSTLPQALIESVPGTIADGSARACCGLLT
jgi:hypothetical protein